MRSLTTLSAALKNPANTGPLGECDCPLCWSWEHEASEGCEECQNTGLMPVYLSVWATEQRLRLDWSPVASIPLAPSMTLDAIRDLRDGILAQLANDYDERDVTHGLGHGYAQPYHLQAVAEAGVW
jgi:hypothetical protein